MSAHPEALRAVDDMVRHLRNSFARNHGAVTRSMEGQVLGLLSHWLRERLAKNDCIRPGLEQQAKWGRCSERQARRNQRQLEAWGVVRVVADGHGGRSMRPAMTVHIDMLLRALTAIAMRISKALVAKIRAFIEGEPTPVKADKKADTMSPAYIEDTQKEKLGPIRSALMASIWSRYQPPRRSKRLNSPTEKWMVGEKPFSEPFPHGRGVRT